MTVSIIIAVKTWQKNLEECAAECLKLDYPDFEIIILPDADIGTVPAVPVRIIPTGPVSPAKKRDMALNYAKGDILAFIDDDAYPVKDWLTNAVKNFEDPEVAAVGGPAVTPASDNIRQKASGRVYASILVSGSFSYRYLPKRRMEIDDYPSCNFFVRKSVMLQLGGFNTNFWPGEDTKLCLDITKKLGKKIVYDPEVMVYHHRRPLFIHHLGQIASYALHRGYFVKRYPETSLKPAYFVPTLFLFGIIIGAAFSLLSTPARIVYSLGLTVYLSLVLISSFSKQILSVPYVFCGTILTHFTYGFYFLKGLISSRLREEDLR